MSSSRRENGAFVGHMAHAACGSSDGLAIYQHKDGTHSGFCWSCSRSERDPLGEGTGDPVTFTPVKLLKTDEDRLLDLSRVYERYPVRALVERGITEATCRYFDVRSTVSQEDGQTTTAHYYPYYAGGKLRAYKVRRCLNKEFFTLGFGKEQLQMFGQYQAALTGAKRLIVCGGEVDAMTVYQILVEAARGTEYEKWTPAVVSPRNGEGSTAQELSAQPEFMAMFSEVVLCLDNDKAGQDAAAECARLWPDKVKLAKPSDPYKDPNEMLMKGQGEALRKLVLFKSQQYKPASILTPLELVDKAVKPIEYGLSWPWSSLTRLSYGLRRGELIGLGAGVGVGKSTAWHQLQEHLIRQHKCKVGAFFLEEPAHKVLRRLAGKLAGVDYMNPDCKATEAEVRERIAALEGHVFIYDKQESTRWDDIRQHIRHLVLVEGVKDIIIDPLSSMTFHLDSSKTNDELNRIFGELEAMASALDFTLYYSSHLNPPDSGPPHEEGGRVKLSQFTGSRAMMKFSHYVIALERNTQAESEEARSALTIRVLKDREHGRSGFFHAKYIPEQQSIVEVAGPVALPQGQTMHNIAGVPY
jgi:twinkle protein